MTEYEHEPVPGLPGRLPPGERIVWQGSPDRRALARTAFHWRGVAAYFVLLTGVAATLAWSGGGATGLVMTAGLGAVAVALLHLLAWGSARTTIYTLTDRRVVLRVGMAVPKCVNLPLAAVASVDLAARDDGTGDVALTPIGAPRIGYAALWPHARPFRIARPVPMLRAVPDATRVAALVARHCLAAVPAGRLSAAEPEHAAEPALVVAQAA